jgi:2-dehydropantoate 2-reductase
MNLVIGAGAVGTVLTAYLCHANSQATSILVRDKDRLKLASATQIQLNFADGTPSFCSPLPTLVGTVDLTDVQYLFLCVKFGDLAQVLKSLPDAAHFPSTCTIVCTLNGVEALRVLRNRFPTARVLPLSIMYNAQLLGTLKARLSTRPSVTIGGAPDARLQRTLTMSGITTQRATDDEAVWGKLLINLANALCAITHSTMHELLTVSVLRSSYVAVLNEAIAVLEAAGVKYQWPLPIPMQVYRFLLLHAGPVTWWLARLKNGLRKGSYPSMVSDVELGKLTEVDQLNGEIARLGAQCKVPTPVADRLVSLVHTLGTQSPPDYLTPDQLHRELRTA